MLQDGLAVLERLLAQSPVLEAAQLAALQAGELDVGLLCERPAGSEFDAMPVVRENLGVLLAAEQAAELSGPDGIRVWTR